jgi:hypothetical protein
VAAKNGQQNPGNSQPPGKAQENNAYFSLEQVKTDRCISSGNQEEDVGMVKGTPDSIPQAMPVE